MANNLWSARELVAGPSREMEPLGQYDPQTMPTADDVLGTSSFTRGLKSAALQGEAGSYADQYYKALAEGDVVGAEMLKARALDAQGQAAATAPKVQSLRDIHGVSDALNWGAGLAGTAPVMIGPPVAAGLAGGLIGGAAGARLGLSSVAPLATAGSLLGSTGEVYSDVADAARLGVMNDPEANKRMSAQEILDSTQKQAAIEAPLMMLGPSAAARTLMRGGAGSLGRSMAQHVGLNAGVGAGVEEINQAFESDRNPNRDTSGDDWRTADSAAAFGAFGLIPGAAEGLSHTARNTAGAGKDLVVAGAEAGADAAGKLGDKAKDLAGQTKATAGLVSVFGDSPESMRAMGEALGQEAAGVMVDGITRTYEKVKTGTKQLFGRLGLPHNVDSFKRIITDNVEGWGLKGTELERAVADQAAARYVAAKALAANKEFAAEYPEAHALMVDIANGTRADMALDPMAAKAVSSAFTAFTAMKSRKTAEAALEAQLAEGGVYNKQRTALHDHIDNLLQQAGIDDAQFTNKLVNSKGTNDRVMNELRTRLSAMGDPSATMAEVQRVFNDAFRSEYEAPAVETRARIGDVLTRVAEDAMGDERAPELQSFLRLYAEHAMNNEFKNKTAARNEALKQLRDHFDLGDAAEEVLGSAMREAATAIGTKNKEHFANLLSSGLDAPRGDRTPVGELAKLESMLRKTVRDEMKDMSAARRRAELQKLQAAIFTSLTNAEQGKMAAETANRYRDMLEQAKIAEEAGMTNTALKLRQDAMRVRDEGAVDTLREAFGKNAEAAGQMILALGNKRFNENQGKSGVNNGASKVEGERFDENDLEYQQKLADQFDENGENWKADNFEEATGSQGGVDQVPTQAKYFAADGEDGVLPLMKHPSAAFDNPGGQYGRELQRIKEQHTAMGGGGRLDPMNPIEWAEARSRVSGESVDSLLNRAAKSIVEADKARRAEIVARLKELGDKPGRNMQYAERLVQDGGKYNALRTEKEVLKQEAGMIDWRAERYADAADGRDFFTRKTSTGRDLLKSYGYLTTDKAHGTNLEVGMRQIDGVYKSEDLSANPANGTLQLTMSSDVTKRVDLPAMVSRFMEFRENADATTDLSRLDQVRRAVNDVLSSLMQNKEIDAAKTFGEETASMKVTRSGDFYLDPNMVVLREGDRVMTARDLEPVRPGEAKLTVAQVREVTRGGQLDAAKLLAYMAESVGIDSTYIRENGLSNRLASALLLKGQDALHKAGKDVNIGEAVDQVLWTFGDNYEVKVRSVMRGAEDARKMTDADFDLMSDKVVAAAERIEASIKQLDRAVESTKARKGSERDASRATVAERAATYKAAMQQGVKPSAADTAAYKKLQAEVAKDPFVAEQIERLNNAVSNEEWARGTVDDSNSNALRYSPDEMQNMQRRNAVDNGMLESSPEGERGMNAPVFDKSEAMRDNATVGGRDNSGRLDAEQARIREIDANLSREQTLYADDVARAEKDNAKAQAKAATDIRERTADATKPAKPFEPNKEELAPAEAFPRGKESFTVENILDTVLDEAQMDSLRDATFRATEGRDLRARQQRTAAERSYSKSVAAGAADKQRPQLKEGTLTLKGVKGEAKAVESAPAAPKAEAPKLPDLSGMTRPAMIKTVSDLFKSTAGDMDARRALYDQAKAQNNVFAMNRFKEGLDLSKPAPKVEAKAETFEGEADVDAALSKLNKAVERTDTDPFSKQRTASFRTDSDLNRKLVEARKAETLGDAVKIIFEETTKFSGKVTEEEGRQLVKISTFAERPMETYNHEGWHAVENIIGKTDEGKGLLASVYKATSTPWMKKFLADYFKNDPEVLKQLENERERAAYAFQLYAAGVKLPLGEVSQGFFRRWINKLKQWAGFVDNAVRTGDFYKYVDKGGFLKDMENPQAWLRAVGETRTEQYAKTLARAMEPLTEIARTVFSSTYDRVKQLKNEHYDKVADLYFGRSENGLGMIYKVQAGINEHMNLMQNIVRGSSLDDQVAALKILRGEKPEKATKESVALAKQIDKLLDKIEGLREKAGLERRLGKDRLDSRLDYDMIEQHRAEFEQDLKSYGEAFKNDGPGTIKSEVDTILKDRQYRGSDRLFPDTPKGREKAAKWMSGSLIDTVAAHVRHQMGSIEEASMNKLATQKYGKDIKGLLADGDVMASDAERAVMRDAVDAAHNKLGGHMSPAMRKLVGGIIVAENIVTLPFGVFSQMMDPLVLAMRKNEFSSVFEDFGRGMKDSLSKGWSRDPKSRDHWETISEQLGTIAQAQIVDSLGDLYSGVKLSGKMHKVNNLFFRFNFMEQWNRSMHVAATKNGIEFIKKHAAGENQHSERFLKDLGLSKADVKVDKNGDLNYADPKIRDAINQFVVESVVHPDASTNPLWANDMHFALIAHMKRFTFAFSKFVLERAQKEVEHGNLYPLMPLLFAVPWMIAADFFKSIAKADVGTGSGGFTESLMRGVERAGLLGRYGFGSDAYRSTEMGGSAIATLLGPAAEDANAMLGALR